MWPRHVYQRPDGQWTGVMLFFHVFDLTLLMQEIFASVHTTDINIQLFLRFLRKMPAVHSFDQRKKIRWKEKEKGSDEKKLAWIFIISLHLKLIIFIKSIYVLRKLQLFCNPLLQWWFMYCSYSSCYKSIAFFSLLILCFFMYDYDLHGHQGELLLNLPDRSYCDPALLNNNWIFNPQFFVWHYLYENILFCNQ